MADFQRKRKWSRGEILKVLKDVEGSLEQAANIIFEAMSPEERYDQETKSQIDKVTKVAGTVKSRIAYIQQCNKDRKFKNEPSVLDEPYLDASQYSVFDEKKHSQNLEVDPLGLEEESSLGSFSQELIQSLTTHEGPKKMQKKPLTDSTLTNETLRRRVQEYRLKFREWASEQGCSMSELAGLILYLEHFNQDKDTSSIGCGCGWNLFRGKRSPDQTSMSLDEALWMLDSLGLSQAKYHELRQRLGERLILPPLYTIQQAGKDMMPKFQTFKRGILADLSSCLEKTLTEELSFINPSDISPTVEFSLFYGLDERSIQYQAGHHCLLLSGHDQRPKRQCHLVIYYCGPQQHKDHETSGFVSG